MNYILLYIPEIESVIKNLTIDRVQKLMLITTVRISQPKETLPYARSFFKPIAIIANDCKVSREQTDY